MAFTQKVLGKGHAAARMLLRNGRVYHLYSRLVYRAIGREHLRNRREHSVEHVRTKLAILDFVLGHLDYRYLETEDEKVAYFCKDLGIARFSLPTKHYAGAIQDHAVKVKGVAFYHGGDPIFTLEGASGLWLEECQRTAEGDV